MKEYDLPALANASGADLIEFIGDNQKVIGEVTGHIANLERLKGTSQAHALGYKEYLPDEVTLNDMSVHLSKKGYQMSLESLSAVLLVAASAAVIAGIGIIAYKLMKASMVKEPKAVKVLEKQKEVQAMVVKMQNIHLTELKPDTQARLKDHILQDCVAEVIAGQSDADLLNKTYNAYVASELVTSGAPYWSAIISARGEAGVFVNAASNYIAGVKESVEAFRREFLDVIAGAPDMTDHQMINLVKGLKWDRMETTSAAGIMGLVSWVSAMKLPSGAMLETTVVAARDILGSPVTGKQAAEFDHDATPVYIGNKPFELTYKQVQSLKETSKYIEGAKGSVVAGEKRSQQVVDMYNAQIHRAEAMIDMLGAVEQLIRLESTSHGRLMQANVNASKRMLNMLQDVIDKLEDKDEIKELKETIELIVKSNAKNLSMKVESLEAPRRELHEIMIMEGHGAVMDFLKVLGIALVIGLAIHALGALIMSMLGLASFSAGFRGGLAYMDKAGKRITTDEAAKAVAVKAKANGLNAFGVEILAKSGKAPFYLSGNTAMIAFEQMRGGIARGLSSFSTNLHFTGDEDKDSQQMVKASAAAVGVIDTAASQIIDRLKQMGVPVSKDSAVDESSVNKLKAVQEDYRKQWFTAESADYSKIERGINSSYFGTVNAGTVDQVSEYANKIKADLQNFGSHFRNVSKEKLAAMSDEARAAHRGFMQSLAYLGAVAGVMEVIVKEGIAAHVKAMASVRDTLKMQGENFGGVEEIHDEGGMMVDYVDPLDHVWDSAEGAFVLESEDQTEIVMESWQDAAKMGITILGVMALMGIGAMILKRMTSGKGAPKASSDTFSKVAAAQQVSSNIGDMAEGMQAAASQMAADVDQAAKLHKWKADTQPTRETIGQEDKSSARDPEAAKAAPETPKAQAAADAKEALVDMVKVLEQMNKLAYRERLVEELLNEKAGLATWGMTMMGQDKSYSESRSNIDRLLASGKLVVEQAVNKVLDHASKMAVAPDPVAYAEKHYDEVMSLIADISKQGSVEEIEEATQNLHSLISEARTPPDVAHQRNLVNAFSDRSVANAEKPYNHLHTQMQDLLSDVEGIILQAERGYGDKLKEKLDALRGQNNKASSLLRRIDEFRPLFTASARNLRTLMEFGNTILDAANRALMVHRLVQRGIARDVREGVKYGRTASECAERVLPGSTREFDKELDDMIAGLAKFKDAGL